MGMIASDVPFVLVVPDERLKGLRVSHQAALDEFFGMEVVHRYLTLLLIKTSSGGKIKKAHTFFLYELL